MHAPYAWWPPPRTVARIESRWEHLAATAIFQMRNRLICATQHRSTHTRTTRLTCVSVKRWSTLEARQYFWLITYRARRERTGTDTMPTNEFDRYIELIGLGLQHTLASSSNRSGPVRVRLLAHAQLQSPLASRCEHSPIAIAIPIEHGAVRRGLTKTQPPKIGVTPLMNSWLSRPSPWRRDTALRLIAKAGRETNLTWSLPISCESTN